MKLLASLPTKITLTSSTTMDHCYTNYTSDKLTTIKKTDRPLWNHTTDKNFNNKASTPQPISFSKRKINKVSIYQLRIVLAEEKWTKLLQEKTSEVKYIIFRNTFNFLLNQCCPI